MTNPELFPTIGAVAEVTENLQEHEKDATEGQGTDDEERPVQEIESLCMKCGEQVSSLRRPCTSTSMTSPGCYKIAIDIHPVLPGGDSYVLPLRFLRLAKQ